MTCTKTGARIYFLNYGMWVVGDAFFVGDCFIFRWNIHSKQYENAIDHATHIVEDIAMSDSWWHRDDLGVTVVPAYLVTALDRS